GAGFRAWLLAIARRLCLSSLRAQRHRAAWTLSGEDLGAVPDGAPRPERLVEQREFIRIAAQEVNALPVPYRTAFRLFLEEHPQSEIAAERGISADAAAKRIQRARRLLQPRLGALLDSGAAAPQGGARVRPAQALTAVERALTDVVSDYRVVNLALPGGG